MPLLPGKSNIGNNISEMKAAGHPLRVARAAALNKAYGSPKPPSIKMPLQSLKIKSGFQKMSKL